MVLDVSLWFFMVLGGSWCFLVVLGSYWWFMVLSVSWCFLSVLFVVLVGSWQFFGGYFRFLGFLVVFGGSWWFLLVPCGSWWLLVVLGGS